jgi:hypothetical protein
MSDITVVGPEGLIEFFSLRAQEIASAAQLVKANTTAVAAGGPSNAGATNGGVDPGGPRTITLQLVGTPANNSNNIYSADQGSPTPSSSATLVFDVAGNGIDGYPQRIDYTTTARQAIHNTAVGFYVDEFNEAPGQLDLDIAVLYRGVEAQQVQAFFNLINQSKLTNPLANEPPYRLRYFDSHLQRKLIITQENVRCSLDADQPNRARLSISASILYDYSSPQPSAPAVSAIAPGQPPASLGNSLLTLGTFTLNGTSIGNTIGSLL